VKKSFGLRMRRERGGGHVRARLCCCDIKKLFAIKVSSRISATCDTKTITLTMSGLPKITRTPDGATFSVCQDLALDHVSHPALSRNLQEGGSQAESEPEGMRYWAKISLSFIFLGILTTFANACVLNGPRYQLASDTVHWSLELS
jgi:hypothetical protein